MHRNGTADVELEDAVPAAGGQLLERTQARPARVVHQDVDLSVLLDRALDHAHDVGLLLHVGADHQAASSGRVADRRRDLLELRFGAARDHEIGAVLGEQAGRGRADAGAAAGDDRDATAEIEGIHRGRRAQEIVGRSDASTASPDISRPVSAMSK